MGCGFEAYRRYCYMLKHQIMVYAQYVLVDKLCLLGCTRSL
nr:MAG TPA: hypothetical protein [Caudoviricetes sp.]